VLYHQTFPSPVTRGANPVVTLVSASSIPGAVTISATLAVRLRSVNTVEAIWDKTQTTVLHVQDTVSICLRSDIVPSEIQGARFHQVLWAR
jgi:hypothetical protein